ncbi:2-amino-4-hydroxy-6-hydroxymethyldihydropteridine diphosphokinase [Methylococcus sp. EFPC2]|uniref:2-amino-4-hydroxy-6- hydroxymethyldihydropteridine diphosphokinase n=1 Tax=Methylococcus sp. EFPC2 TaxID=2812648 RepID=UPI001967D238|nr:2-amino-4-hydroxy-6-hydroxymethyldihydropteridine diphosphokinase [Methylococcus sp. EFPC2]QSA97365.1 2-amino-4-hydroxy-6-hydroxymethyldihydropteridine diphosphokinase [Methylococcus sp. EFPC2]
MPEVFVSLGSNVERDRHVPAVLRELGSLFGPLTLSSVYESEAVGFQGDPFYNLVLAFHTERPPQDVARALSELETLHGRTRDSQKFAPRPLDLDLILYGDEIISEGKLRVPRADLTEYAFMLEPMAEIAPDRVHPVLGKTYRDLWAAYDKGKAKQQRIVPPWQTEPQEAP